MKESTVNDNTAFISYDETAAIAKPGKGAFDLPSAFITAQFATILVFLFLVVLPVRADQLDASSFQPFPQRIAVIPLVSDDPFRLLAWTTATAPRDSYLADRRFEQLAFAWARRVQVDPQRNSLAVDHHHPLRSLAAFGLPNALAPFFADAKLPSAKASLQSNCSSSSSSDNSARHAVNQMPSSSQSRSLRQQVDALGYSFGSSDHGAPVRNTQRIPSKTFRLSIGGLPPCLPTLGSGSKGPIFAQWASVSFHRFLVMGFPPHDHYSYNINRIKHLMKI